MLAGTGDNGPLIALPLLGCLLALVGLGKVGEERRDDLQGREGSSRAQLRWICTLARADRGGLTFGAVWTAITGVLRGRGIVLGKGTNVSEDGR